jgi:hypothetical protein
MASPSPVSGLTEKQSRFVLETVRFGRNPTQAARIAGYSEPGAAGWDLIRTPSVQEAVRLERERLIGVIATEVTVALLERVQEHRAAGEAIRAGEKPKGSLMADKDLLRAADLVWGRAGHPSEKSVDGTKGSDLNGIVGISLRDAQAMVEAAKRAALPVLEGQTYEVIPPSK